MRLLKKAQKGKVRVMKENTNVKKSRKVKIIAAISAAVVCVGAFGVFGMSYKYAPLPVYVMADRVFNPDNVQVNFNTFEVASKYDRDKVKIYEATDFNFDDDKLQKVIWNDVVKPNDDDFFGNTYENKNESITVCKAPESDSGLPYFYYSDMSKRTDDELQTYTVYGTEPVGSKDNCVNINTNDYYRKNANIAGMQTYEQSADEVIEFFETVGLQNVELEASYAIENEATENIIKEQILNLDYIQKNDKPDYEEKLSLLDENDETYKLFFRQSVDSIPLVSGESSVAFIPTGTSITAEIGDNISEIRVDGSKQIGEAIEEVDIMSASEALNMIIEKYNNEFKFRKAEILSMKLMYYARKTGDGQYQLEPRWVFNIKETYDTHFGRNESHQSVDYGYRSVNAVTGHMDSTVLRDIIYFYPSDNGYVRG